jgi:hypothetical protein
MADNGRSGSSVIDLGGGFAGYPPPRSSEDIVLFDVTPSLLVLALILGIADEFGVFIALFKELAAFTMKAFDFRL